mgnify:CR=1 FL=1
MVAVSLKKNFFQAEDGIRDVERSRGLGDVYKRQVSTFDLFSAITCQQPRLSDTHLSVTPLKNSYAYKEVITFSCSEGYQLIGSSSKPCRNDRDFQRGLPNCTGLKFANLFGLQSLMSISYMNNILSVVVKNGLGMHSFFIVNRYHV